METDRITIRICCISLILILVCEISGAFIIAKTSLKPMIVLGFIRFMEILLLLLLCYVENRDFSCLGMGEGQILPGLKKGIVWSLVFAGVVIIVFIILWIFNLNPLKMLHIRLPEDTFECIVFFIVGGFIGPVAEEIFFRGILYGFFRKWGVFPALGLSSLFFVLLHSSFGLTQVVGSIVFALAYEIEGKLMVPVVIHVTGNTALFSLSFI
ncbi:CPBP intramembrane metalloprotease family protein [Desulfonema limicola]|uniref:CPBP intramembrane metalloprotease family protein n=1 Tax=Desulfonema limicola TaxID=45656 RepID=A0A975BAV3_9BACT|nr:CPBP family intramembrane glutamic endopeptidase [Desulfonema limicola]QTA81785.1 CPBP intramembrane metalloprotease family protein [Desulfonema limicola]